MYLYFVSYTYKQDNDFDNEIKQYFENTNIKLDFEISTVENIETLKDLLIEKFGLKSAFDFTLLSFNLLTKQ
jgi:hypothetical protein